MFAFVAMVLGLAGALVFTPLVLVAARSLNAIDRPQHPRKLHEKPVPLWGGIALYLAFGAAVWFFHSLGLILDDHISSRFIYAILAGGGIIIIGGTLDDIWGLAPWQQFIFPVLATIIAVTAGITILFVTHPLGGVITIPVVLGQVLTIAWLLGMMYTTKFLDGLDGLVTGISAIASLVIFFVSLNWDVKGSGTGLMAMIVCGVCLGFLIFNFYPAKIFLGEGGSVFLGFILGILSIISGSKIAAAFLVMGMPIMDAFWVIIQRIREGRSPVVGDRKHFHFRLLDRGLSQRQAVLLVYAICAIFGSTALFLGTRGKIAAVIVFIVMASFLIRFFYLAPASSPQYKK